MKGILIKLKGDKGYGFVSGEDGKEYFLHKADFNGHWLDLLEDFDNKVTVHVEFDPTESVKGLRASNVTRIGH